MNPSRLRVLGALAVLILAAGLLVANLRTGSSSGDTAKALYPALKTEADTITAVRLFKAGDTRAVELVRKDDQWTVSEREGYPADAPKVRQLILTLSDAKILEQKTANAASYSKLGVEDVSGKDATGVRIEMSGGKTPVNVIVGKGDNGDKATYVRRVGEAPSWLVDANIEAPLPVDAWLRRDVLDVPGDRVQSAAVTIGDKSYTAAKSARADGEFKIEGLPKGKDPVPGSANSFATALQGLSLSEVRTAKDFGSPPPSATATIKTFDGRVLQLTGWVQDPKRYISITSSYDESLAKKFELPVPAEPAAEAKPEAGKSEQTKPEAAKEPSAEQRVREEVESAKRLEGWVFEIPAYKYDVIFKPVDQLLKK